MAKKILVVDDDGMNLRMADMILKKGEYEVTLVQSGEECLVKLKEAVYDLVLLDIEMPVMNGVKVLENIRSNEEIKDTKVLILTGTIDSDEVLEAKKLGAIDCVQKPFVPQVFLDSVKNIVGE